MISFIKNLSKAVPPRARIMMITVLVISGVAAYYMYTVVVGDDARKPETEGKVTVKLAPREQDISKPNPSDSRIVPDDSPIAQTVKAVEEERISGAKSGSGSYIQSLRLKDSESREKKSRFTPSSEEKEETVETILAKRQAERDKRRTAVIASTRKQTGNNAQVEKNQILAEFLASEITKAETAYADLSSHAEQITARERGGLSISSRSASKAPNNQVNSGSQVTRPTNQRAPSHASEILGKNGVVKRNPQSDFRHRNNGEQPSTSSPSQYKGGAQNVIGGADGMQQPVEMIQINSGNKYYAILHEEVNTDEPTYITATIVQEGPLKGARFLGMPKRVGESAVLEFSNMTLNGKDKAVAVVATDPDTGKTRLSDDVNRHILERYTKLGLASFIEGYAEALVDTTTNSSAGMSQTVQSSVPDPKDRIKVAGGKIGEKLSPIYLKEFSRPPTVTVNGGRAIGIMFISGLQVEKI